jgi:hypothetical protein
MGMLRGYLVISVILLTRPSRSAPAATEHVGPVGPLVRYEENWARNKVAYCVVYACS